MADQNPYESSEPVEDPALAPVKHGAGGRDWCGIGALVAGGLMWIPHVTAVRAVLAANMSHWLFFSLLGLLSLAGVVLGMAARKHRVLYVCAALSMWWVTELLSLIQNMT